MVGLLGFEPVLSARSAVRRRAAIATRSWRTRSIDSVDRRSSASETSAPSGRSGCGRRSWPSRGRCRTSPWRPARPAAEPGRRSEPATSPCFTRWPSRTATLVSTPASWAGTSASASSRSTTDSTSSGRGAGRVRHDHPPASISSSRMQTRQRTQQARKAVMNKVSCESLLACVLRYFVIESSLKPQPFDRGVPNVVQPDVAERAPAAVDLGAGRDAGPQFAPRRRRSVARRVERHVHEHRGRRRGACFGADVGRLADFGQCGPCAARGRRN